MQRIGHLVEAGLRRIALLGQSVGAVETFLRQNESGLRALQLRLPRGDDFHPGSDEYVGKLCLGNGHRRSHLFELCDSLRIIDAYEHSVRRDVLAALDGYFLDPSVDPRGDVEPRCIGLALHEQWFRPQEIEERKRDDENRNGADDNGRSACDRTRNRLLSSIWRLGHCLTFLTRGRVHALLHLAHDRDTR